MSKKYRKCEICDRDNNEYKIKYHSKSGMDLCDMHYSQMKRNGYIKNILPYTGLHLEEQKFNKLTVKKKIKLKDGRSGLLCECECGNLIEVRTDDLQKENIKTCGKCTNNTYEIYDNYVIGTGVNGLTFEFDLEDFERVSKHSWRVIEKTKVVLTTINKETIPLHKFIMNVDINQVIDHRDGNPSNNRKYNLRNATSQENSRNQKLHINNTSGVTGVWYDKSRDKWVAEIGLKDSKNSKRSKHIKRFIKFIDAVIQRIKWEVKYFREFRSDRNDEHINNILNKYNYKLDELIK